MTKSIRIAVYVGERDALSHSYVLRLLGHVWRADRVDLQIVNDPQQRPDADLAWMHVDATRRPAAYEAVVGHYPYVVNGTVRDISKRTISSQLVERDSDYDGPVIVKTNQNFFGRADYRQRRRQGGSAKRRVWQLAGMLPTIQNRIRRSGVYPRYDHVARVPPAVWRSTDLVVERYLPERHDDLYCLRTWVFLGEHEFGLISYSKSPIVKASNSLGRQRISDVPQEIRQARRQLGFDYGKFDYVIHNDQPVLLDVTPTPAYRGHATPRLLTLAAVLGSGIEGLLPVGLQEP